MEFSELKTTLPFEFDLESIIDDWVNIPRPNRQSIIGYQCIIDNVFQVLMGFLVGNDFIPHLPELHISSGALPMLFKAYKDVLPTLDGTLSRLPLITLNP